MVAACGGDNPPPSGQAPTPTATVATCDIQNRLATTFDVFNTKYLFPNLLDTSVNRQNYSAIQPFIDALVAPARAQNKDRGFSYVTSIAEENARIQSGATAGFGIRLVYDTTNARVFIAEAFENGPAFAAGIDRGTELLAINGQTVSSLFASGGAQAVSNALGPSDAGTTRTLRFRPLGGAEITASVAKADYNLDPVSDRYGALVLDDGGKKVGYLNLRTFGSETVAPNIRSAVQKFRDQGVTEIIVDLRYNGGGLVSMGVLLTDLLARSEAGSLMSRITFRPSRADENQAINFSAEPAAIDATKIAFISTGGTASASEFVPNNLIPVLGDNLALVGTNSFGKPVGQEAYDITACDDRLRVVALQLENRNGQGEYFTGLASVFPNTCRAGDDIFTPFGDPTEASISAALDFLAGRSCTPIASSGSDKSVMSAGDRVFLQPEASKRSGAQWEIPGIY
ncbi:peptidase S41 [Altererythrobacter halimionae]|uniref:Peptidase S41 n=2 Tax=Alteriqipengyuania halimionae TaxID=1926630 RepID=A0A6I4U0Y0_9SPHN|nr:peptidase S41 [Alteriqipengyuania halimionae]